MIRLLISDGIAPLQLSTLSPEHWRLFAALSEHKITLSLLIKDTELEAVEPHFGSNELPLPQSMVRRMPAIGLLNGPLELPRIRSMPFKPNEIAFLSCSPDNDVSKVLEAGILPLSAGYCGDKGVQEYGLSLDSLEALKRFIVAYGRQDEPYFGWRLHRARQADRQAVEVSVLFGDHKALHLTKALKKYFKRGIEVNVGPSKIELGELVLRYLISQLFLSGVSSVIDCVTVYPGHTIGTYSRRLESFCKQLARVFRLKYCPCMLLRHRGAKNARSGIDKLSYLREQFQTVHVNPAYKGEIEGKNILVLDDFTVSGSSFESSRQMLLQAGAARIMNVAVARRGDHYFRTIIAKRWNPFIPNDFETEDFNLLYEEGDYQHEADEYFHQYILGVEANSD